ncbi:MAG: PRC-barrel domain-containing protein [Actinomycetota bacterium]|nr:PRC-barrel domain-containing protein [Actinomycetota bacterium]
MTDSFKNAHGRKVVSRTTAEALGELSHMVVDTSRRHVSAIVVNKGKKHAFLVDWEHVSGFGPDAVMVESEDTLRPPADDQEQEAAGGKLELVGKRALSERGNELGPIADVEFDPDSGNIGSVLVGEERIPATDLLGVGSYAAVLAGSDDDR